MAKVVISVPYASEAVIEKLKAGFLETQLFGRFFEGEITLQGFKIRDKLVNLMTVFPMGDTTLFGIRAYGVIIPTSSGSDIKVDIQSSRWNFIYPIIAAFVVLALQPTLKTIVLFAVPAVVVPFACKYYMEGRVKRFLNYIFC